MGWRFSGPKVGGFKGESPFRAECSKVSHSLHVFTSAVGEASLMMSEIDTDLLGAKLTLLYV